MESFLEECNQFLACMAPKIFQPPFPCQYLCTLYLAFFEGGACNFVDLIELPPHMPNDCNTTIYAQR